MSSIPMALPAINTLLQRGDGNSPEVYTTVANVGDLTFNMSAAVVDVTSHSTGVPWRQKIPTLLDAGEITLPLFFVPSSSGQAGHNDVSGLMELFTDRGQTTAGNPVAWRIVFPDTAATKYYYQGFVTKFAIKAPVAGVETADVTITLTSEPVFA